MRPGRFAALESGIGHRSRASGSTTSAHPRGQERMPPRHCVVPRLNDEARGFAADTDLVLIWGGGFASHPYGKAKIIFLNAYLQWRTGTDVHPDQHSDRASRATPTSRGGERVPGLFPRRRVADAETLFAAIGATEERARGPGSLVYLVFIATRWRAAGIWHGF